MRVPQRIVPVVVGIPQHARNMVRVDLRGQRAPACRLIQIHCALLQQRHDVRRLDRRRRVPRHAAVRRDHAAGPEVGDGERDLRTGVGERLQILLDLLALITAE